MRLKKIDPPRVFKVGSFDSSINLSHVIDLNLDPDEQVTLIGDNGGEFDICRKSWGYYATPSINHRLKDFGYRTCIVESSGRRYLHLVEQEKINEYLKYLEEQRMKILFWLDEDKISIEENG
ncbi:MAG: hypothetical protein HOD13_02800 [Rhodospirillaceae bacterium]|nr:hypothetical protein [Rhodospirillaceae bacterium]MBT5913399.1 hypothetical protein [Rhodospirillaceae bacterium]MBT6305710.1 hypothetical protein [Rhodospirillaceae bacterium]MBT7732171.1 hypothetical protein [Rhodospirillaceae bacterium]MDC0998674.1 hypothetical protein [Alphaproteobacteria bacterium]